MNGHFVDLQVTGWHLMVMRLWPPLGPGGKRGMYQRSLVPKRRKSAPHVSLSGVGSPRYIVTPPSRRSENSQRSNFWPPLQSRF